VSTEQCEFEDWKEKKYRIYFWLSYDFFRSILFIFFDVGVTRSILGTYAAQMSTCTYFAKILLCLRWLHFKHSRNYMFVHFEIHIWFLGMPQGNDVVFVFFRTGDESLAIQESLCSLIEFDEYRLSENVCNPHTSIDLNKLILSEKLLWRTLSGIYFTVQDLSVYIRFSII
jgi:hypothetical protein